MNKLHLILFFMAFAKMGFAQEDMSWTMDYDNFEKDGNFYKVQQGKRFGYTDAKGKMIVPVEYINIYLFRGKKITFCLQNVKGRYGAADSLGKIIVPCEYDNIIPNDAGYYITRLNYNYQLFDYQGNKLTSEDYKFLAFANDNLLKACKDDKSGCIDFQEQIVIPFQYDCDRENFESKDAKIVILSKDNQKGLVNLKNETTLPFEYDYLSHFSNNLWIVRKKEYYGLMSQDGKVILDTKYRYISPAVEDLMRFDDMSNLKSFINKAGEVVFAPVFKYVSNFHYGLSCVSKDSIHYYFINTKGEKAFEKTFSEPWEFISFNVAEVPYTDEKGLINRKGERILPEGYNNIESNPNIILAEKSNNNILLLDSFGKEINRFEEGYIHELYYQKRADTDFPMPMKKNGKWGYINTKGQVVVDFQYDKAARFQVNDEKYSAFAQVCKGDKCGIIDSKGRVVLPLEYEYRGGLRFSKAMIINKNGKVGVIDHKGKTLIPFEYDRLSRIEGTSYFDAEKDEKEGILDEKGAVVIPLKYNSLSIREGQDYIIANENGKFGIIDFKNNTLISFDYDYFKEDRNRPNMPKFKDNQYFVVLQNDLVGVVNTANKLILPCKYESISLSRNKTTLEATLNGQKMRYLLSGEAITIEYDESYLLGNGTSGILVLANYKSFEYGVAFPNGKMLACYFSNVKEWKDNPNYVFVTLTREGYGSRTALFNVAGDTIMPFQYASYHPLGKNLLAVDYNRDSIIFYDAFAKKLNNDVWGRFEYQDSSSIIVIKRYKNKAVAGVIDEKGKLSLPLKYDFIQSWPVYKNDKLVSYYYQCLKDSLWGIMNEKFEIILPFNYQELIRSYRNSAIIAKKNGKKGVVNYENKQILPFEYDEIIENTTYYYLSKNGKYGTVDFAGKIIIPLEYDNIELSYDSHEKPNHAISAKKNGKSGLINFNNELLFPFSYDRTVPVGDFKETGKIQMEIQGKWGFFNTKTNFKIPSLYTSAEETNTNQFKIRRQKSFFGKEMAFFDENGKELMPKAHFKPFYKEPKIKKEDYSWRERLPSNEDTILYKKYNITCKIMPIADIEDKLWYSKDNNYWGLMNDKGKFLTSPNYSFSDWDRKGEFIGIKTFKNGYGYAILNLDAGVQINEKPYDDFWIYENNLIRIKKGEKYGVINSNGKIIVPLEYSFIDEIKEGCPVVQKSENSKYSLFNNSGKIILKDEDFISLVGNGLVLVSRNKKAGFIDITGKTVIPFQYEGGLPFKGGVAVVKTGENTYQFINKKAEKLLELNKVESITTSHDWSPTINEVPFVRFLDGTYEYIDSKDGKILRNQTPIEKSNYGKRHEFKMPELDLIYQSLGEQSEGFIVAQKGEKYAYLNSKADSITAFQYDAAEPFSEGLARVKRNGKYGFIDKSGKEIISCISSNCNSLHDGLIVEERAEKWGAVDRNGTEAIPYKFDFLFDFQDGYAKFYDAKTEKCGLINKKGNVVIPAKYVNFTAFDEGFAFAVKDSTYGLIDLKGNELSEFQYQLNTEIYNAYDFFHDGFSPVGKTMESNNFMNKQGKLLLPEDKYDYVKGFKNGFAPVYLDGKAGLINTEGKEVVKLQYDDIQPFSEGLLAIKKGTKWGFMSKAEKLIIPHEFDEVSDFESGIARVRIFNKMSIINKKGEVLLPFLYDTMDSFENGIARVTIGKSAFYINLKGKRVINKMLKFVEKEAATTDPVPILEDPFRN